MYKTRASELQEEELWTKGLPGEEEEEGGLKDRVLNAYDDVFTSGDKGAKKKMNHAKDSAGKGKGGWRSVDMIVQHHNYTTEALSWKGHDVGLFKLEGGRYGKRAKGSVAPACLPTAGYDMERHRKHTYFAGWGRRFSPYCITDDLGPESNAVCGSYKCGDPRTTQCGMDFIYKGEKRKECIRCGDSPSLSDPTCKNLLESLPELEKHRKKMHVFQDGSYVTTCYPRMDKEKGWCTIQHPGKDQVEPEPNKGWGFCSHAEDQKHCNNKVPGDANLTAFRVEALSKEYCVTELGANLAAGQPAGEKEE